MNLTDKELLQQIDIDRYKTRNTRFLSKDFPAGYSALLRVTSFLPASVTTTQRLWHVSNNCYDHPVCEHCNQTCVSWDIVKQIYRRFCGRKCAQTFNGGVRGDRVAASRGEPPICANVGCTNLTNWYSSHDRYHTCCSKSCYHSQARIVDTDETDEEIIKRVRLLPQSDWRRLHKKDPALFNAINRITVQVPATWQIRKRIRWLLGDLKSRQETIAEQFNELEISRTSFSTLGQARAAKTLSTAPTCLMCDTPRKYKPTTRRYSKFCSDACILSFKARQEARRLEKRRQAEEHRRDGPWNKITDPRLNDATWLHDQHIVQKLTKQQIAAILHVDKETITNRFKLFNIIAVRHPSNSVEQEIATYIRSLGITDVVANTRKIIKPKELDIYLPQQKLAIEYCGLYFHSDHHARLAARSYHADKYNSCAALGIRLLTIFEDEWIHKKQLVLDKIAYLLGRSKANAVYARKTRVGTVNTARRREFLNAHHIQGDAGCSVSYGLFHEDTLVAVIGLQQRAIGQWVIARYATSCTVVGGFSKLLAHTKRNITWSKLITFADRRWSTGDLYKTTGFRNDGLVRPDYSYINTSNVTRIHKFNFRHKFLRKRLAVYDDRLSETQNIRNNNVLRIWDCGKIRYVLENL